MSTGGWGRKKWGATAKKWSWWLSSGSALSLHQPISWSHLSVISGDLPNKSPKNPSISNKKSLENHIHRFFASNPWFPPGFHGVSMGFPRGFHRGFHGVSTGSFNAQVPSPTVACAWPTQPLPSPPGIAHRHPSCHVEPTKMGIKPWRIGEWSSKKLGFKPFKQPHLWI